MSGLFQGGEDALVARLARLFGEGAVARGAYGIGDDAAVLPGRPRRVVSTDAYVEGVHFELDLISPDDLGRRVLAASLSDVAAMGAAPEYVFLAMAWPEGGRAARRAAAFVEGLAEEAGHYGVTVMGGDSTRAPHGGTSLTLTVTGRPHPGGPVLRSGGKRGDRLVVTGPLGGAAAGLDLLTRGRSVRSAAARDAVRAHRTPRARTDLAAAMARHARGLIDLSDGLALDLPRLAAASRCGFTVTAESVPVHPGAVEVAGDDGGLALALSGGDDYELLAAVPARRLAPLARAAAGAGGAIHEIGHLTGRRSGGRLVLAGRREAWPAGGWDPFA